MIIGSMNETERTIFNAVLDLKMKNQIILLILYFKHQKQKKRRRRYIIQ
jgi:hypothetical protein